MEGMVLDSAVRALSKYPLCDRCLGRLYARLGRGWSNKSRGDAVKRVLVMELHWRAREGDSKSSLLLQRLAPNIGWQALEAARQLNPSVQSEVRECYVCRGLLDDTISRAAKLGAELLRAYDVSKFVVGVRLGGDIRDREEEVKSAAGAAYSESIKAEIRREVGKAIASLGVAVPDFDDPEATILVSFPGGDVEIQVNSLLYRARYWKLGRNISQAYWPTPEGPRYFSVEQALWPILSLTGGERVVIHAAGREDVDARMLGSGRPMIVEVKTPRRRRIPLGELERAANSGGRGLVSFRFEAPARRAEVELYKEETARVRKSYRAVVAVEGGASVGDASLIKSSIEGITILQRTPSRVLHRRPDIVRRRKVFRVECSPDAGGLLLECLVEAEGGLYVKELVSGDGGRTTPSFAEVLGRSAVCVELDVLWVEHESLENIKAK